MRWAEPDWLHDAELLGHIGRRRLAVVLDLLAPALPPQNISLPDPRLPDSRYFAELAALLRCQPIKVTVYLPPFLSGAPQGQARDPPAAGTTAPQRPDPRRYVLQKGQGAWGLIYAGEPDFFFDRAGMDFVEYLLKHPVAGIHSLELLARVQGEAPVQQRSAALDDADTTRGYLREMARLRAVLDNEEASEREKQLAEDELGQLETFTASTHQRTIDQAFTTAKTIRQSIRRVIGSLAEAQDEQHRPHPAISAFAAHLHKYLLIPSQSGSVPAGHLVYEPPEDVVWE